jgi:hypothetical protein
MASSMRRWRQKPVEADLGIAENLEQVHDGPDLLEGLLHPIRHQAEPILVQG